MQRAASRIAELVPRSNASRILTSQRAQAVDLRRGLEDTLYAQCKGDVTLALDVQPDFLKFRRLAES